MVKQTLENPYKGINAHLHSLAQNPVKRHATIWTAIHASLIGDTINALNTQLPLNYVARPEQSLQIWTDESHFGEPPKKRSPRPDVSVFRTNVTDSHVETSSNNEPVRVIAINPFLEEEITIPSAVIYEVADHEISGKPVTRIELLSASNKRGGTGEDGYRKNRMNAIRSGTSLIELDYLHQSVSPLPRIPAYPYGEDSHPYYIALTDCRDGYPESMNVYIRDVNQALPSKLAIPLAGEDSIVFDFEAVYQHTFKIGRWGIHIDYADLPRNFESYSEKDQQAIHEIMEGFNMQNGDKLIEQIEVKISSGRYIIKKLDDGNSLKKITVFNLNTGLEVNAYQTLEEINDELSLNIDIHPDNRKYKLNTRELGAAVIQALIETGQS